MQIAHPTFLDWTLPAIEGKQVRMAHVRPAYENVSLHGDVFSQVSLASACPLVVPFLPTGSCLCPKLPAHCWYPFCPLADAFAQSFLPTGGALSAH